MPGIIPHRHCIVCGKAIEPDKVFCSDDCEKEYENERKRQRKFTLIMFAMLFFFLLFLIFIGSR